VHDTPLEPQGVLAPPGTYTVRLTVDGATYVQPLHIVMDPRVDETPAAVVQQTALAQRLADAMNRSYDLMQRATARGDKAAATRYGGLNASLGRLYGIVEGADAPPTDTVRAAATKLIGGVARGGNAALEIEEGDEP
jgi:hypothetical protein